MKQGIKDSVYNLSSKPQNRTLISLKDFRIRKPVPLVLKPMLCDHQENSQNAVGCEYNFKDLRLGMLKVYLEYMDRHLHNIKIENKLSNDLGENLEDTRQNMMILQNILSKIKDHNFNTNNYSTEEYLEIKQTIIKKIVGKKKIIQFLQFLVHLTVFDDQFIVCGSSSLHLLVSMKVDLTNQSFEDIRIKNTSLIGANFFRCNFNGSKFDNVDISGLNLNGALLFNCRWKNIKIHELNKLDGHNDCVCSVCISPNGKTLASGGGRLYGFGDCSIRLWDVKTGQQKVKLDGHSAYVQSVCFSPDGATLASDSSDNSIHLWDVKTGQQIEPPNKHYKDILAQSQSPLFQNNPLTQVNSCQPKHHSFNLNMLQSQIENLSIIKEQIYDHY